jgi:starch phosphorylase
MIPKQCGRRRSKENVRTGLSVEAIEQSIVDNLNLLIGRLPATATAQDWYIAVAYTVRDRILERWMGTIERYIFNPAKSVSYLSAEFLIGPQLLNNMINLGIAKEVEIALDRLGLNIETVIAQEQEPGLGNGGLGRLAACYLDSLSSLEILAVGYGIRYEFGIFKQTIQDGWQVEQADHWTHLGHPWEIVHPEICFDVNFGGHLENGEWKPSQTLRGVACDMPITGFDVDTVNLLRLWKAEAAESFNFQAFNAGEYWHAVEKKVHSENITKVLYPNDESTKGKELRLIQQYFFVSCSLQDMIRVHKMRGHSLKEFHNGYAIQLNDTHPSIAIPELMRLLVDVHGIDWNSAWEITKKTFAYTNHTLLPEALEKWPLQLFQALLPRHLEIIFRINHDFLDGLLVTGRIDQPTARRLSIIDEEGHRSVCMAHLATIGSHTVNGVADLHTNLLQESVLADFYRVEPTKFCNVTNGVTPRRWVVLSNPQLSDLICEHIGTGWINRMEDEIIKIEAFANNESFQSQWAAIKRSNKVRLSELILERTGIEVDPDSLFDVQVKRIHEYKRQHLNILHVIARYLEIKKNPQGHHVPRTVIFAGKAAPGYVLAKLIIKLINSVADIVNCDPDIAGRLRVVFIADFNVKNGHLIYPAADLSEQISTAGKEASGTGNMKFAMNGALTIGTLDGANVEIRKAVGAENFFLFGLTAPEVMAMDSSGYQPLKYISHNSELREVINLLELDFFSPDSPNLFKPIVDSLKYEDRYKLLADFAPYVACQHSVDDLYRQPKQWIHKAILNLARIGSFSSDRSIREYREKIWKLPVM